MKVLLAVGGSDDSLQALEETVERAAAAGDDLTIAVVDNPDSERSASAVESAVRDGLAESGVAAEVVRLTGDPGSRVIDYAEDGGFDQIVIGGGHRSPMGKIQLGRIAEFVLLNAQMSVKLVR